MGENRGKPAESSALDHTCYVCHSTWAHFGFELHRGETWFCGTHRDDGVRMWEHEKAGGAGQRS